MGLNYNDAEAYYRLNFSLAQFHNWSITEIEDMLPFEREAYTMMLTKHLEEKQRELEERRRG